MLSTVQHLRAWIVADDTTVPAIAVGDNVTITDDKIRLTFVGGGAELYAIACGKKYQVERHQQIQIAADVTFRSQTATIKSHNQYCEILAQDDSSDAIAFYREANNSPVPVKIVSEIAGSNQIEVGAGGKAKAAANLVGKTVKILRLSAVYPEAVLISNEDIQGYRIFSLYQAEKTVRLSEYNDCQLVRTSQRIDTNRRTLEFTYSPSNKVDRRV